MNFLNCFYHKTLKFDLINKFYYTNLKKLPKLTKVVLSSNCRTTELKPLATHLLALELVTNQRGKITLSKKPNLVLKIKKGSPTGCKLTLKKSFVLDFLSKNLNEIFPKIKNFKGIIIHKEKTAKACLLVIKTTIGFNELSEHYQLFNNLVSFDLSFITNTETAEEIVFFFKSLQLPIKLLENQQI